MPAAFTAPYFNYQIKRAAHDNPPKHTPGRDASYSEVREFLYAVLTLRSHGICIETPGIVSKTVNDWIGDGKLWAQKCGGSNFKDLEYIIPVTTSYSLQQSFTAGAILVREVKQIAKTGGVAPKGVRWDGTPRISEGQVEVVGGSKKETSEGQHKREASSWHWRQIFGGSASSSRSNELQPEVKSIAGPSETKRQASQGTTGDAPPPYE